MDTTATFTGRALATAATLLTVCGLDAGVTPVTCRIELEREVLAAGREQTAVIKVVLDAPERQRRAERPPVNLSVVLDRSGSMTGTKIEKAKEAAITALRRLDRGDVFSLVTYDHQIETVIPAQEAVNTEWIEGRIRTIAAGGNTALFGGVSQGAAEVRKRLGDSRFVHRIILLSDGLANVGPSSPEDLGRLGAALIKEGISVTTVGVGTDYNEDLMTQLSQKSDGNSYFVESSTDLPRIFANELGDVLSIVARKVLLEIECSDGTRPVRIIGRDGRILGNRVEIHLNQLYGGQEKFALIELSVPATSDEAPRELAVARCRYEDAVTQRQETSVARAHARFSRKGEEVSRSVNRTVQSQLFENVVAAVKDEAIRLNDAGDKGEAVKRMNAQAVEMEQVAGRDGNRELLEQSAKLRKEADRLSNDGMDKRLRKAYRSDSYQIRTQQKHH